MEFEPYRRLYIEALESWEDVYYYYIITSHTTLILLQLHICTCHTLPASATFLLIVVFTLILGVGLQDLAFEGIKDLYLQVGGLPLLIPV